jgi:RNA recognition motif-containing protein
MNLYVSNLGFSVTEEELKALFTQHGQVSSAKVITDYNSGQSRGFAFVEMPNDEEAQAAINKLNNTDLNSRQISVQVARPKEDKPKRNNYPERDGYKRY